MRSWPNRLSAWSLCAVGACGGSGGRVAGEPARREPAHAPAAPASSAAVGVSEPLALAEPAEPATSGTANLLALVPSQVAVSSTVANPRDFPEYLMDGRLDTAWNGKTGDLHASIWFRVPRDAKVERVELTVGYDRRTAEGDLFTMNHRIARIAVRRDGVTLREVTLDPDQRGWQSVPVDAAGGDFQLQVLATKPGSKKRWKEIVVSELRVVGTPGAARRPASSPLRVGVGGLDATPTAKLPTELRALATVAEKEVKAACAKWVQDAGDAWQRMQTRTDLPFEVAEAKASWKAPFCSLVPWQVTFQPAGGWKDVRAVRAGYGADDAMRLMAQTERGWVMTPLSWDERGDAIMGCPTVWQVIDVPEVRVEHGFLVAVFDGTRVVDWDDRLDRGIFGLQRGVSWCKDTGVEIQCEEYSPQFQDALATKAQLRPQSRVPWAKLPWTEVRAWHLNADGTLEVK